MREMKDSGVEWIGEIPVDWTVLPNKRVMSKVKNICEKYAGEDILSLTMNGVIVRDLENPIGKMPLTFDGYQYVEKDNLLMCLFDIDVTPRCIGIIKNDGLTSPAYTQFRLQSNALNRYFYYYYLYLDFTKELLHVAKNLRHSLTESQLGELYVPLPSMEEQKRIADYLDEKCSKIDAIIEKQQSVIEKLREYKLSAITEAVTKGLNPDAEMKDSGIKWIGEIPRHWNIVRLKYLIQYIESGVSVNAGSEKATSGELGVLKTSCVSKFEFDINENKSVNHDEESRVACPVIQNTIIVSRMNTPELVGACGYVEKSYDNIFLPDRLWQVHFCTNVNVKYIWYFLQSKIVRSYYASLSTGTSSTMQNISQGQFSNVYVALPTIDMQEKIALYLDKKCANIDATIVKKEAIVNRLTEYKKSLIYEVVTGKKEV